MCLMAGRRTNERKRVTGLRVVIIQSWTLAAWLAIRGAAVARAGEGRPGVSMLPGRQNTAERFVNFSFEKRWNRKKILTFNRHFFF